MNQPDIISRLKQGDPAVFAEVVDTWKDMVFNTAISIVQDREDAEEITQDVFVQLYRSVGGFREESLLSTWLYRVTIRKALDAEKMKKRQKRTGILNSWFGGNNADEPAHFEHPGVLAENKETAKQLFAALKKIPEKQRVVFTLQKMEGLGNREIAAIMNTSLQAVESLQVRAKKSLRVVLENYYQQHIH